MFSQLIVLVILILLNAYFAASEIAFISLNDAKIEKLGDEGETAAGKTGRKHRKIYGKYRAWA